jgi:flagellar secretion chaperone FliS
MPADFHNQYRETAVTQAEPTKLVEMLYEGALRFLSRAQKSVQAGDPEAAHVNILRCYAIVAELMATLDFEHGGEIAIKLEQCYEYILHLLKEADIRKSGAQLEQVRLLLEPMRDAWCEAFSPQPRPPQDNAGNAAGRRPALERKPIDVTG